MAHRSEASGPGLHKLDDSLKRCAMMREALNKKGRTQLSKGNTYYHSSAEPLVLKTVGSSATQIGFGDGVRCGPLIDQGG